MKKVREVRNYELCLDTLLPRDINILRHYVNRNFKDLKNEVESHYTIVELTDEKQSIIHDEINVFEIVFICDVYYNKFNDICEIEIIAFL